MLMGGDDLLGHVETKAGFVFGEVAGGELFEGFFEEFIGETGAVVVDVDL